MPRDHLLVSDMEGNRLCEWTARDAAAWIEVRGYTVYPPGSAVPALVEAARAWIRDECVCVHYTNSDDGERTRQTLDLEIAARKVAGEGER